MIAITVAVVLGFVFLLVNVQGKLLAKVVWGIGCLLDIIVTYSTIQASKGSDQAEMITDKGKTILAFGAIGFSVILVLLLAIRL